MLSISQSTDIKRTAPEAIVEPKVEKKKKIKVSRYPRPVKRFARPGEWTPPHYRGIVKKELDEGAVQKWLATAPGFLTGLTMDMEDEKTKLYDYQQQHMLDKTVFRIVDKSRQTGFSYAKAGEALAKSHLKLLQTSIFISKDQEEANEKIRFARSFYYSLPEEYKRKCIVDNKQSLEFEYRGKRTRILSFAQRQPRGKGNNTDILLDEFAHMMWANEIYVSAVPVITRGSGTLTLGSTPLGKGTKHYQIFHDKEHYPTYSRMQIAWWDCDILCNNVEEARKLAPFMETKERIEIFGTLKVKEIYLSFEEEEFQQEFELFCADSTHSYYSLDLIRSCVFDDEKGLILEGNIDPDEIPVGFAPVKGDSGLIVPDTITNLYKDDEVVWYCDVDKLHDSDNIVDCANDMIDRMLLAMSMEGFGRTLLLGIDIGRQRDSSEISILEEYEIDSHNLHVERISLELVNVPFRKQKEIVQLFLKKLPITKANFDGTQGSHGADLAETLAYEFPDVVESIQFAPEIKAQMAKNFRFRLEDRTIALINDSDSIKQIHSIKKVITESANVKFSADKTKKHHGDKFWSKALASIGGQEYDRNGLMQADNVIRIGDHRKFVAASDLHNDQSVIRIAQNSATPSSLKHAVVKISKASFGDDAFQDMFSDSAMHKF